MRRLVALCLLFLLPWMPRTAAAGPGAIPGPAPLPAASPLASLTASPAAIPVGSPAALPGASPSPSPAPLPAGLHLPWIARRPAPLLIAAAYIDSTRSGEADEAVLLWNVGAAAVPLAGWALESSGKSTLVPPAAELLLAPGQRLWLAAEALAFRQTFGAPPAAEWAADTDPLTPDLTGKISLPNAGGALRLLDPTGAAADVLLYGDETSPAVGWTGPPAQLYTRTVVTAQGQVWQRKRDPQTGLPQDANGPQDWAGDLADPLWGRQVRWPGWRGWDAASWALPQAGAALADTLLAVGPEGLYVPVAQTLDAAQTTIDLSIYTLEHPQLAQLLAAAARRGVKVRVLLDGAPPGGITPLQKWCVALLAAAGGDVRYFALPDTAPAGLKRRYRYVHAKYGIVDAHVALVLTENFSPDSMPLPSAHLQGGRRGFALLTNAPPVIAALAGIFAADWAPDRFLDLRALRSRRPSIWRAAAWTMRRPRRPNIRWPTPPLAHPSASMRRRASSW